MPIQQLICDLPVGDLYVSSTADDPYHLTFTTVTRASGRMPRKAALGCRFSSLNMAES